MTNGIVKWFNGRRGYGFISPEEGDDVFVHYSDITGKEDTYKTLNEDDKVEFEIVDGEKGPKAINVVVTEAAPPKYNYRF